MSDSSEGRRLSVRNQCFAKTMLKNTKTMGYLADISETGFKVRIMEHLEREAAANEVVGIQFNECNVQYFQVDAKLCWRRDEEKSTLLGFEITSFETVEGKASYESIRKQYGESSQTDFT